MTTALLVGLGLALLVVGGLAAYWRGMLEGKSRIPTSAQIMLEMQETYDVAMKAIVGDTVREKAKRRQASPGEWKIGLTNEEIAQEMQRRRDIYDAVNKIPDYYELEWQRKKNAAQQRQSISQNCTWNGGANDFRADAHAIVPGRNG
ncbi:hypothetical protein [Pseudonocardia sp. D17]|uniref:hypothetical protein n=1 Tax=Pseudonocardia sp. D17 TaxID=882661 RepID=UPI002B3FAD01|nr:hypothetical protein PSD17_25720 [Pseudonocardia sp. D17]